MLRRAVRPLSARRPLPWGWWLPSAAIGLLVGQALARGAGTTGTMLAVAAMLASPAASLAHRSLGSALLLGSSVATLGAVQMRWQQSARERRAALITGAPENFVGHVRSVKRNRGRSGDWVSLDVALSEPSASFGKSEIVRLAVWKTERDWRLGEQVAFRSSTRAPRGFCNRGEDGYAGHAWRSKVIALASVPADRAVAVSANGAAPDLYARLGAARDAISRELANAVEGADERAVLRALILGDQSSISRELRRAYARTGTAHVLSVSGLHIALVAMTAYTVLARALACWPWFALRFLASRVAACLAIGPAAAYALLSGGAVATVRALVMGALVLGGLVLLRRADVWTALATAALLVCAFDPGVGADPSFQLSFASVVALVVAGSRLRAWRAARIAHSLEPIRVGERLRAVVVGALVLSTAAGIATAPLTAFHFGSVSLIGPAANLIVVPVVGWLVLLLAFAGVALLPLWGAATHALFALAAWCLRPADRLVAWLGGASWSALDVALASPLHVIALLACAAAIALPLRRSRIPAILSAATLLGVWLLGELCGALQPSLVVRFLDVGQGDASVVELPGAGGVIVTDGGGSSGAYDPGERVVVPALWRAGARRVRALALSHPEHDHYGGLAAVARALPVGEFWSSGRGSQSGGFQAMREILAQQRVAERIFAAGDRPFAAGRHGEAHVLHPSRASGALERMSENDASLVLRISYGASRVLLTGDVEAPGEAALLRRSADLAATIVKVPHHGSRTSSTRGLVLAARPGVAVAMLGANNRFGFPAPDVRARYTGMGAAWLQTDRDGEVVITSDGQLERVQTCR